MPFMLLACTVLLVWVLIMGFIDIEKQLKRIADQLAASSASPSEQKTTT